MGSGDLSDKMRKQVESVLSEDFTPQNAFAAPIVDKIKEGEYFRDKARTLSSEPIDDLISHYTINEISPSMQDALNIPLNDLITLDANYRWRSDEDLAVNIRGTMGRGKSNTLLYLGLMWSKITGVPYRMSNIVWNLPEYNLLLKGYKVRNVEGTNDISLEDFELEAGTHLSLDEAGDSLIAGNLSMTVAIQTADLEARGRALRLAKICAGVKEILHISYYSIYMVRRDTQKKVCTGIVYAKQPDKPTKPLFLGYVNIPYVKKEIYEAYNAPKLKSIKDYGRGITSNRIASIFEFFRKELWEHPEYQALPLKPTANRLNWLKRNPRYSIFPTEKYFGELEKLTRNQEFINKQKRLDVFTPITVEGEQNEIDAARQAIADEWSKMKANKDYRPSLKSRFLFKQDLEKSAKSDEDDSEDTND